MYFDSSNTYCVMFIRHYFQYIFVRQYALVCMRKLINWNTATTSIFFWLHCSFIDVEYLPNKFHGDYLIWIASRTVTMYLYSFNRSGICEELIYCYAYSNELFGLFHAGRSYLRLSNRSVKLKRHFWIVTN